VAGAAALYLATHPTATPQQVRDALVGAATPAKLTGVPAGTPNLLLFTNHGVTLPPPPPGCAARTNDTDIRMPDAGRAVGSRIAFIRCAGNASSRLRVEVHVKHTYRGDVKIDLVAPDGTVYPLKPSSSSDGGTNIDATYRVNASSEPADGTWLLSLQDRSEGDVGFLDSWRLAVKG